MKQVTIEEIHDLALSPARFNFEFRFQCSEWLEKNARHVAEIELKLIDKTNYGQWPAGWKVEMKKQARLITMKNLIEDFMRNNIIHSGGAYWLQTIQ